MVEKDLLTKRLMGVVIVVLLLLLFIIYKQNIKDKDSYNEQVAFNEVLADTLKHYKGKDGENRARIAQFRSDKVSDFLALKTLDSTVLYLQGQVKRYKKELGKSGSVTVAEITGNYDTKVPTEVVETKDPESPIYKGDSKDRFGKWAKITSVASRDSTSYTLETMDKITFVLGREKTGFLGLGKGKPFADITNENPYSKTKSLRSYEVQERSKRFTLGFGGTYGATYLNGNIGIGGSVGLSINWKLTDF